MGLTGKVDRLRRRDGMLIPYEQKRGSSVRLLEKEWMDEGGLFARMRLR